MWDAYINDIIINFYAEYYAKPERAIFIPDLLAMVDYSKIVIGGDMGIKYLLDLPVGYDDGIELYSETMMQTAKEICTLFYERYKIPMTAVKTVVYGRELNVVVASRSITRVFQASTTNRAPVTKRVKYWKFPAITDRANTEDISEVEVEFKLVSPYLYFIEYLSRFNDPLELDNRDKNSDILRRLVPMLRANGIAKAPITQAIQPQFDDVKLREYIRGRVIVYNRNGQIILITNSSTDEEIKALSKVGCTNIKSHNIQLPGTVIMEKITAKSRFRISVYNMAYYRLVSYTLQGGYKFATPNWILYVTMIEDNTGLDLTHHGILKFYTPIASLAYTEVKDLQISPDRIYGYYIPINDLKKRYINSTQKTHSYYPVMHVDMGSEESPDPIPEPLSDASPEAPSDIPPKAPSDDSSDSESDSPPNNAPA